MKGAIVTPLLVLGLANTLKAKLASISSSVLLDKKKKINGMTKIPQSS